VLVHFRCILGANKHILGANVPLRFQYAAFGYKSVSFEKVQPQWQLLYLFFWEW